MKLSELFPKPPKPLSVVASGQELMRLLEDGKAGRITIRTMECVTGKNGSYRIYYELSNRTNVDTGAGS